MESQKTLDRTGWCPYTEEFDDWANKTFKVHKCYCGATKSRQFLCASDPENKDRWEKCLFYLRRKSYEQTI